MKKEKIFISHSSKDVQFVKSFVENILVLGLDIPSDRIFCSSMEGQGVKSGQYIPDRLREEIKISSLALLFISDNYKLSEVGLNEVGAAWVTLTKETVIPLLLPETDFSEIGFLDVNRLGLKIYKREGILKLIQDCKEQLNPSFNLEKLHDKIDIFISDVFKNTNEHNNEQEEEEEFDEWTECFTNNLEALDEIIRKAIPAKDDGIHKIVDVRIQNQILTDLGKAKFLRRFWYKYSGGDYYVEQVKKLKNGNWLISTFGWEIKVGEMYVCMDSELQYEFILIKSENLEPYEIQSDVGGTSYTVGVMNDGTIISENERGNGFAIINGETVRLSEFGVEPRQRKDKSRWVFLVSSYHKAGYNAKETFEFCKQLDNGEIEVTSENIYEFLKSLRNNPTVMIYR
jgi:hypothetical protein